MKTDIILISGKMGSGKTTLTHEIIKTIVSFKRDDWKAGEIMFATPIKMMHDECRTILQNYGVDPIHKKDGNLLQYLGTEWGRKTYGDDVWIRTAHGQIQAMLDGYRQMFPQLGRMTIILSDCRFKNEFDAFPEAIRVRLTCPESVRKSRAEMWRDNSSHISETDLDEHARLGAFDLVFDTSDLQPHEVAKDVIRALLKKDNALGQTNVESRL